MMMTKKTASSIGRSIVWFTAVCVLSVLTIASSAQAAPDIPYAFDANGEKIFDRYTETPLAAMTGTDGRRTLNTYYDLRQYPGSPPRIPHKIATAFAADRENCLSCHGRGGFVSELDAYAPVTPHPEYESCQQCHVPILTESLFVESNWLSIPPPKLGRSQLGGSPPPIPHSLQLRDDCIACHTGPAAVAEIRVEHASRGNCRQCHVPMESTRPVMTFQRTQ